MNRVGRRALRLGAIGLAALAGLYLTAGNALLNLPGGLPGINPSPDKARIRYAWGFTPWPGRIVLGSFRIEGHGRRVDWSVAADRASGTIELAALARRRLVIRGIRGAGVEVRLATRKAAPAATATADAPAEAGARTRRWTIALSDVAAETREIAVDDARLTGSMDLRGGMEIEPKKSLRLAGVSLVLRRTAARHGGATLADPVDGTIEVESDAFAYRGLSPADAASHFSGRASVELGLRDVSSLARYLPVPWITIERSEAQVHVEATLEEGRLAAPTRLALRRTALHARILDYRAEGEGELTFALRAGDDPGYALDTTLEAFQIRREGFDAPHVRGRGLAIHVAGDRLPLPGAVAPARVTVDLPEAEVPDLRFYNAYLPAGAGLQIVEGRGTVSASLAAELPGGSGTARMDLVGRDAKVRYKDIGLSGTLHVHTRVPAMDLGQRTFVLSGTSLRIDDGVVHGGPKTDGEGPWWLEATVSRGGAQPGGAEPLQVALDAKLSDSRPLLALFAASRPLPGWIERVVRIRDITGTASLTQTGSSIDLRGIHVSGSGLDLRGRLTLAKGARRS